MITMVAEFDWMRRAACEGMNRDVFFPGDFELPDPKAKATCRFCPVRDDCLDWALRHSEVGIWGGLTDDERNKITVTRSRVRCPDCRSDSILESGRFEICLSCGLSWPI